MFQVWGESFLLHFCRFCDLLFWTDSLGLSFYRPKLLESLVGEQSRFYPEQIWIIQIKIQRKPNVTKLLVINFVP